MGVISNSHVHTLRDLETCNHSVEVYCCLCSAPQICSARRTHRMEALDKPEHANTPDNKQKTRTTTDKETDNTDTTTTTNDEDNHQHNNNDDNRQHHQATTAAINATPQTTKTQHPDNPKKEPMDASQEDTKKQHLVKLREDHVELTEILSITILDID